MHQDTGKIRREEEIPKKEKKKYASIIPAMMTALSSLTPDERVQQLALERRVDHYHKLERRFFHSPGSAKTPSPASAKKKAKRKLQKESRRRNRK